MAKLHPSWDHLTKELESDDGLPAKHRIVFHCFNPKGLYYQLQALHYEISVWCEHHKDLPNGVLLVHGSLNDYPRQELFKALNAPQRRKNVTRDVQFAINIAANALREGREFLDNPAKWPAPKGNKE